PAPLLVELFRKGKRILHALDVTARAGIAVPVPGAAHAAACFEYLHAETQPAQPMQHVHAGKACADDDGVKMGSSFCGTHACGFGGHYFVPPVFPDFGGIMPRTSQKSTMK